MRNILFLAAMLVCFTGLAHSASVGTAPGFLDFEEIEPGESYEHTIYVTTNFDDSFTVEPSVRTGSASAMFRDSQDRRYETSEQDITGWVELEDSAVINTSNRYSVELDDGSTVNAYGEFDMMVDVPSDAEPGYHYGRIRLNPQIQADDGTAGTVNWGETITTFRFRVPGEVQRDLTVQDVRGFRTSENQASIEVLLTNTGSVTTSSQNFEVDLMDSRGDNVETLTVSGLKLEPGESEWTNARWRGDNVDEGTYQLDGEVDYLTGSAFASGSFSLDDIVQVVPEDSPTVDDEESERATVPLWLVFMVLALLGVLMWSFDIEPFWILAIVGGLAVASFILLSGVSNYLLVVLLMTVGIVVYGVM